LSRTGSLKSSYLLNHQAQTRLYTFLQIMLLGQPELADVLARKGKGDATLFMNTIVHELQKSVQSLYVLSDFKLPMLDSYLYWLQTKPLPLTTPQDKQYLPSLCCEYHHPVF